MLNYKQRVMYCKHCGKEIADDSVFCQYCGGELQELENEEKILREKQNQLSRKNIGEV